jgi:hypothetical protein
MEGDKIHRDGIQWIGDWMRTLRIEWKLPTFGVDFLDGMLKWGKFIDDRKKLQTFPKWI